MPLGLSRLCLTGPDISRYDRDQLTKNSPSRSPRLHSRPLLVRRPDQQHRFVWAAPYATDGSGPPRAGRPTGMTGVRLKGSQANAHAGGAPNARPGRARPRREPRTSPPTHAPRRTHERACVHTYALTHTFGVQPSAGLRGRRPSKHLASMPTRQRAQRRRERADPSPGQCTGQVRSPLVGESGPAPACKEEGAPGGEVVAR